jgi:hypothetical protein
MTQGYLVMAQGAQYAHQAEQLARSIKLTQSTVTKISVITDQQVDHSLFDQVIFLEQDLNPQAEWKIENRVQFYDLTPYDQTVILDSDMLFLSDVSHWWLYMEKFEMLMTSKVQTYRGETVLGVNPYRRTFAANNLPNVYSAFTYFKKTPENKQFFDLLKQIVLNWNSWVIGYAPQMPQKFPSIDLAMAIAVKILGLEDQVINNEQFPTFTHMKSGIQGWKKLTEDWSQVVQGHFTDQGIKLGPYVQTGILHYVKKDFV